MTVERYQLLDQLGRGLMSEVWVALDISTNERVVLKIMIAIQEDDRRNQKAQERFLREIKIASSLRHPNIVPILDYGYVDFDERMVPFLVLPYISEGSLADMIARTPPWQHWTLVQTGDAVLQAAESLLYLHTHTPTIVHQDVKPGNYLVRSVAGSSERAVELLLCDFGISRWQPSSMRIAMASELLGTFQFIAPEQIKRQIHPASDQYALAVMACYMLTGKLPVQAATNEEYIKAHLYEPPLLPSQLNPLRTPPSGLDLVMQRALEKDPDQRFATIVDFARALQEQLRQLPQQSVTAPAEQSPPTTGSRMANKLLTPQRIQFEPVVPIHLDASEQTGGRVLNEPLPARPVRLPQTTRNEVLFAPLSLDLTLRKALPARPKQLRWSPDGEQLVCVLYGTLPQIVGRDGRVSEVRTTKAAQAACVCWSPDGGVLAVSAQGEIRFWDVAAQAELPLVLTFRTRMLDGLDWSEDGQLAIWIDSQIYIFPLDATSLHEQVPPASHVLTTGAMRCASIGLLRWSPDGGQLAAGASNGEVMNWQAGRQSGAWQVAESGQKATGLCWSADSSLLVVAFRDNRVCGWDIDSLELICQWERLPAMPRMLSISSGQRITLASSEKRLLTGFPFEPVPSQTSPGQYLVAWSPRQEELATLDVQKDTVLTIWSIQ